MKHIFFVIGLLCSISVYGQPAIQWQHCYGGSNTESNYNVIQTTDGGYMTVGSSNSVNGDVTGNHGNNDLWVVKMNSAGAIQWQKSYGGTGNDIAMNVIQLPEGGGYVIDAYKYSTDVQVTCTGNYWLIKIDDTGALVWQKCLKITLGNRADHPTLIQTPDQGFALLTGGSNFDWPGGHGQSDILLVKFNSNGDTLWHKSFGGSRNDYGSSISKTQDRGFIISGYTQSNDGQVAGFHYTSSAGLYYDYWVIKTDSLGNFIWGNSLGGLNEDIPYSVSQTNDGGYIVAGYTNSNDSDVVGIHSTWDYWVVKLSNIGDIQWSKCLGGSGVDYAECIKQTIDGGYIVGGYTGSTDFDVTGNHGGNDFWVVKLTTTGAIQWSKCMGGTSTENLASLQQTTDQGYIISGVTGSNDGDVSGSHGTSGNWDFWVVKLYPDSVTAGVNSSTLVDEQAISIYPNPTNSNMTILSSVKISTVTITNLLGQTLYTQNHNTEQVQVNVEALPAGIYLIKVACGPSGATVTKKFVKQ